MINFDQIVNVDNEIKLIPLNTSHSKIISELYSDKNNVKYMADVIKNWEGNEVRALKTIKIIIHSLNDFVWVIIYKQKKVGLIGLENINQQKSTSEIWYLLDKNFQRKGIMIKSAQSLVNFLKQNHLKKIIALVEKENSQSINLLEKLNFKKDMHNFQNKFKFYLNLN